MFQIVEDRKENDLQNDLNSNETQSRVDHSKSDQISYLNDLREINYFPYETSSYPTMFSYAVWPKERKFLVATKDNSLKEFSLKKSEDHLEPVMKLSKINPAFVVSAIDLLDY